jgi:hypothetical protein
VVLERPMEAGRFQGGVDDRPALRWSGAEGVVLVCRVDVSCFHRGGQRGSR